MTIKSEIDSVQFVKDEIDDIRDSLDRLEAEGERRKAKLLEQVSLVALRAGPKGFRTAGVLSRKRPCKFISSVLSVSWLFWQILKASKGMLGLAVLLQV